MIFERKVCLIGLFGNLFDKKKCSICGGDIGMLSNKKLSDGNCCKDCSKKLSANFSNHKNSTIEDINRQIVDREENRKNLENFEQSRVFGECGCIIIDEKNKQFVAISDTSDGMFSSYKHITSLEQVKERNPDIIKFSQVRDIKIKEVVNSKEDMHTVDGNQVSYNPKHMTYMASFAIQFFLDHPYIETIYVPLCEAIHIKCEEPRKISDMKEESIAWLTGRPEAKIENMDEVYTNESFLELVLGNKYKLPDYSFGFRVNMYNEEKIQRYRAFLLMSNQIKGIIENK